MEVAEVMRHGQGFGGGLVYFETRTRGICWRVGVGVRGEEASKGHSCHLEVRGETARGTDVQKRR